MKNLRASIRRGLRAKRLLLALTLLCVLTASVFPFGLVEAKHACAMPCCAGLMAHEEGSSSCAGNVCHLRIKLKKKAVPKQNPLDPLCGLDEKAETKNPASIRLRKTFETVSRLEQ